MPENNYGTRGGLVSEADGIMIAKTGVLFACKINTEDAST